MSETELQDVAVDVRNSAAGHSGGCEKQSYRV